VVAKRITEVTDKGLITPNDAVSLRQKLVAKREVIAGMIVAEQEKTAKPRPENPRSTRKRFLPIGRKRCHTSETENPQSVPPRPQGPRGGLSHGSSAS
jgi:hypothetical protein